MPAIWLVCYAIRNTMYLFWWGGKIILVLTDPSLDAKAAEIASMVGGGKDSNLDDDQESEGHGSISAGIPSFKRSLLIHLPVVLWSN